MRATLRFVIVAAVLLALVWAVGSLPGTLTARSGPYTIETSVPAAILAVIALVALLTLLLRLVGGLRRAPGGVSAWRGGRRQRLGEVATQRGIVALAAGDAAAAATEAKRARNLLGDAPLTLLLAAEAARLGGQHDDAAPLFQKLTAHPDMAFLGHRGLLRHRLALGDHDAAQAHAEAAAVAYPKSTWLRTQRRDIAVGKQDWPAALQYAETPAETAAFATAAARATADPQAAVRFGKQAQKAAPTLAPAVVAHAEALRQTGDERGARKALLAGWAAAPHPEIAAAFVAPAATPIDRARAAADLAAARPGHPESELLLAETALDARLTGEAQRHADAVLTASPGEPRAARVLAVLGGAPAGPAPTGGVAPAAGQWVCAACGTPQAAWLAVCPRCHEAGSLAWRSAGTALA